MYLHGLIWGHSASRLSACYCRYCICPGMGLPVQFKFGKATRILAPSKIFNVGETTNYGLFPEPPSLISFPLSKENKKLGKIEEDIDSLFRSTMAFAFAILYSKYGRHRKSNDTRSFLAKASVAVLLTSFRSTPVVSTSNPAWTASAMN
jgi:hypothetical protein